MVPTLPRGQAPFILRTDFTSREAWSEIASIANLNQFDPGLEQEFPAADLALVDDPEFDGLNRAALLELPWPDPQTGNGTAYFYVVDSLTVSHPDHPLLAVNLSGEHFRLLPTQLALVEANLSISNLDFTDFVADGWRESTVGPDPEMDAVLAHIASLPSLDQARQTLLDAQHTRSDAQAILTRAAESSPHVGGRPMTFDDFQPDAWAGRRPQVRPSPQSQQQFELAVEAFIAQLGLMPHLRLVAFEIQSALSKTKNPAELARRLGPTLSRRPAQASNLVRDGIEWYAECFFTSAAPTILNAVRRDTPHYRQLIQRVAHDEHWGQLVAISELAERKDPTLVAETTAVCDDLCRRTAVLTSAVSPAHRNLARALTDYLRTPERAASLEKLYRGVISAWRLADPDLAGEDDTAVRHRAAQVQNLADDWGDIRQAEATLRLLNWLADGTVTPADMTRSGQAAWKRRNKGLL